MSLAVDADRLWTDLERNGASGATVRARRTVRVLPAFNEAAGLADDHDYGTVEQWEVRSGSLEDPERQALAMDEPVRITTGRCDGGDGWEWSDDAEDRTDG